MKYSFRIFHLQHHKYSLTHIKTECALKFTHGHFVVENGDVLALLCRWCSLSSKVKVFISNFSSFIIYITKEYFCVLVFISTFKTNGEIAFLWCFHSHWRCLSPAPALASSPPKLDLRPASSFCRLGLFLQSKPWTADKPLGPSQSQTTD